MIGMADLIDITRTIGMDTVVFPAISYLLSSVWYPNLDRVIRVKLFNFIRNILSEEEFDYRNVNSYFSE